MSNDLITKSNFDIDFKPATLEFNNYDEMKDKVKDYAEQYKGLVFTRDEKYGATQARTELIALRDAIDTNRKSVKQVYNEPLDEFESLAKELTDLIDEPLNDIRAGLKEIDEIERQEREAALNDLITKKIGDTGISIDDVEKDPRWLNKGNWTAKLEPKGKFEAEIENAVEAAVKERDQKEANVKILTEFCKAQDIDPAGWVEQLEYRSATEIIDSIQSEQKRKEQEEKENLERELREKEQEELRQKQADEKAELRKELEAETVAPIKEEKAPGEPIMTDVIEVKGTREQLIQLNKFANEIGIKVRQYEQEETFDFDASLDDLPFF